jgi:C4-dicarboxylate transporter, DctM subunit
MSLYVIGFVIVFLLVLGSGFPVGFGLGFLAIGLLTAYTGFDMALTTCIERSYTALDSNVLVAIPLFVFAAQLISETGMGKRLFDAAKAFLWRLKSGLGVATIASSGVFSAMTGSSFVSASTMGLIAIPELRRAKYSDALISATITSGGSLGSVIPPSLVMIIYGYLTDESIGRLFMAGVVPGVLLAVIYSIALAFCVSASMKSKTGPQASPALESAGAASATAAFDGPSIDETESVGDQNITSKSKALKEAFWGLMAPVIILGGIYFGIFTASEAAAIAVVYCIMSGFCVYRTLTIKKLFKIMLEATNVSAMVAIIVIGGSMLGYVVVFGRIPQDFLEIVISKNFSPYLLLFLINLILFGLGMFMEVLALMYLAIPMLFPVVAHMGWDNIWFAVIFLININLALITPPMGGVLFVVSQVGSIPIGTVIKGALLPITILLLVLLLVIIFPPIATWLPSMM